MYNYYNATFSVATAARAIKDGVRLPRMQTKPYGYVVLIDPPVEGEGRNPGCERLESWCKTKDLAERTAEERRYSQRKGYYGCLCGSNKQARCCCGIPTKDATHA